MVVLIRSSPPTDSLTSETDGVCEEAAIESAICVTSCRAREANERTLREFRRDCLRIVLDYEILVGMRAKKCILHRSWNVVCVVV